MGSLLWLSLGRWRGVKLRLHAGLGLPLGLIALGGFWRAAVITYLLLLVAHELGHAALAKLAGARLVSLELAPLGGLCRWQGDVSPLQRVGIAWGGVLAQAGLFVLGVVTLGFAPAGPVIDGIAWVLVLFNPVAIFVNLFPHEAFDGHLAWRLFPMLRARRRLAELEAPRAHELTSSDLLPIDTHEVATAETHVPAAWLVDAQPTRLNIRPRR